MSELNLTDIVREATINSCQAYDATVSEGSLRFSTACIATNETDATKFGCATNPVITIPYDSDCEYILEKSINLDPENFICYVGCLEIPNKLVTRDFNSIGTTIYPTNFLVTFAALFFVMLVFIRHM